MTIPVALILITIVIVSIIIEYTMESQLRSAVDNKHFYRLFFHHLDEK